MPKSGSQTSHCKRYLAIVLTVGANHGRRDRVGRVFFVPLFFVAIQRLLRRRFAVATAPGPNASAGTGLSG